MYKDVIQRQTSEMNILQIHELFTNRFTKIKNYWKKICIYVITRSVKNCSSEQ